MLKTIISRLLDNNIGNDMKCNATTKPKTVKINQSPLNCREILIKIKFTSKCQNEVATFAQTISSEIINIK